MLRTNWLNIEVDKVVSTIYFLLVLILILITLSLEQPAKNFFRLFDATTEKTSDAIRSERPSAMTVLECENGGCITIDETTLYVLWFLVLFAVIGIGIVVYLSIKRLSKRHKIVLVYFFVREKVIPSLDHFNSWSKHKATGGDPYLENEGTVLFNAMEAGNGLQTHLNNRDWGLAELDANSIIGRINMSNLLSINELNIHGNKEADSDLPEGI